MSSSYDTGDPGQLMALADAAEHLGVHYMTAYRYVRTGRMPAHKQGGKWWVTAQDLADVLAEGTGPRRRPAGSAAAGEPRTFHIQPFTERLVAGDTAGCWDMISDALAGGATPVQVHEHLIGDALHRVGDEWSKGELTVTDEHRATATAHRLLGQMGPLFRHRGRRRGTIVLGAAAGDPHALPSAMLSDMLSDRRFDAVDLGANTPTESFVEAAGRHDDLVGIGMNTVLEQVVPAALAQLRDIRSALPDVFLVVGGPAITAEHRSHFAQVADVVSTSAEQACDAFERALEERRPTSPQQ